MENRHHVLDIHEKNRCFQPGLKRAVGPGYGLHARLLRFVADSQRAADTIATAKPKQRWTLQVPRNHMKIATAKPKQRWILQLELQLPRNHMYSYRMPMALVSLILLNMLPERGPDELAAIRRARRHLIGEQARRHLIGEHW